MSAERVPIKDKLKELRERAGLTQQELAFGSGLSTSIISQIEQGSTGNPRMSTVKALARALGVSADELIELDQPDEPRKPRARKPRDK
jgi:transcriptional regulator with XRE-family HTH domain